VTSRLKGPRIIGLTGSIGMGKSTAAAMFAKAGVPVFDADAEVRRMQGPGGALLGAIEAAFPGSTGPDGVLRDQLGAYVFGDPAALARLEAIVHPAVQRARAHFLANQATAPLVVFDIPLLLEKNLDDEVDYVVVVSAPAAIQRARVLARPGMTEAKFAAILAVQMPDGEKRARADFVIDSSGPLDDTEAAIAKLVASLTPRLPASPPQ
jgi:dephospho-CoA kinase